MYARSSSRAALIGAGAVALALLAPAGVAAAAPGGAAPADSGAPAAAGAQAGLAGRAAAICPPAVPFDDDNFSDPTRIDNTFLPMVPGTRKVYTGTTTQGAHQVIFTVTDLTKVIDGVTTRVVHDVDIQDGVVVEAELAFFAQDDQGNVWNLGEHPQEFEDGVFIGSPNTWIQGLRHAVGGIHMLADPQAPQNRDREYLQGYVPAIGFLDCARVHAVGGTVTVPAGTFTDVLTTYERSPLESATAIQTKEHAPGVGIVRIGAINDPEGETLVLTSNVTLDLQERIRADIEAYKLDVFGRTVDPLYRQTAPLLVG